MGEAKNVRMLVLDVDGVMTDGSIVYDDDGRGREIKAFSVRDGFGVRLWREAGFAAAIITTRGGEHVRRRAAELQIEHVYEGAHDKGEVVRRLATESGVSLGEMACLGDDWPDLAMMRLVGYPMAVADAEPLVRERASYITTRPGGRGAVRDAVEHLLEGRGLMGEARARYD
ncbi:MAG: HAD hydrolase family protein [Phycisphaerales bacterium]